MQPVAALCALSLTIAQQGALPNSVTCGSL